MGQRGELSETVPTDVLDWLQTQVKPRVDAHIQSELAGNPYADQLWYPISTGGKRWRPGLCLAVGELTGVDEGPLLDTAAGIELIHNFTLVHDDVEDGDRYRRGEPAVWVREGVPTAINLGDMMFARGISMFPQPIKDEAVEAVVEVTKGQQMDLDFEDRRDIAVDEYLTMVRKKTGALLDLAVGAPRALGDTDLELDGYGSLGPAFQIRDDLLDFEEGKGREAIGNDIRSGKRTLPVVHADDDRLYELLAKDFDATSADDVQEAIAILERSGSFEFARETMQSLANDALTATAGLPECVPSQHLRDLARFIVNRDI